MFGIKKKGRQRAKEIHDSLNGYLFPWYRKFLSKIASHRKMKELEKWAISNKKKFTVSIALFFLGLISINLISYSMFKNKDNGNSLFPKIETENQILSGIQSIRDNNDMIRSETSKLIATGEKLINQFDSIGRISNKTHEDSVKLVVLYEKINMISNFIEND